MSRADGPERGRKTEGLRSRPVLSPRRREAARREQAKRDKRSTRGRCIRSGPAFFARPAPETPTEPSGAVGSRVPPSGPSGHLPRQGEGIGRRAQVPRRVWGAASQTRPGAPSCVGRDDPGAPNPVPFPVILRPEAEGSITSSAPSSGPAGHLPPSRGEGFGAAPVRGMGPEDGGGQGEARK